MSTAARDLVLCYHVIGPSRSDLSVPASVFERQIRAFLDQGLEPAVASALLQEHGGGRLVVTFDDGYRSILDEALPILDRLGVPGTVFVATQFVGGTVAVAPRHLDPTALAWSDLAALVEGGWEVGSHSVTHSFLPNLDAELAARELTESKEAIERNLGTACRAFAYPYGASTAGTERAAEAAGYRIAFTVNRGGAASARQYSWPRINVRRRDGRLALAMKTSPRAQRVLARGLGAVGVDAVVWLRSRRRRLEESRR